MINSIEEKPGVEVGVLGLSCRKASLFTLDSACLKKTAWID
jgi:hypothetical protein